MPTPETPPDSPQIVMIRRLKAILEADSGLSALFGWEAVDPDNPGNQLRRRIFLDDNGTCDVALSPKLCLTEVLADERFSIFGSDSESSVNTPCDIFTVPAIVVYVAVPKLSDGEAEKILAGNYHAAVRKVILLATNESTGAWLNLNFMGYSANFDQSEGFRRCGSLLEMSRQHIL